MFTGIITFLTIFAESRCFMMFSLDVQCFLDPEILFGLIFGGSGLTWGPIGSFLKVLE